MPRFSVLIPHKKTPANDAALQIALSCLVANTRADYELLIDSTTPADPYAVINSMARRAAGEYLFFSNSDIFVAPGWDVPLLELAAPDTIVNATLIEPGAIGVFDGNRTVDFGMKPETFRRAEFEDWAAQPQWLPNGSGFVFYGLISRATFLQRGAFDVSRGSFPEPLDIYFWEKWAADGLPIVRAASFVYHLQGFSSEFEQTKAVRNA